MYVAVTSSHSHSISNNPQMIEADQKAERAPKAKDMGQIIKWGRKPRMGPKTETMARRPRTTRWPGS